MTILDLQNTTAIPQELVQVVPEGESFWKDTHARCNHDTWAIEQVNVKEKYDKAKHGKVFPTAEDFKGRQEPKYYYPAIGIKKYTDGNYNANNVVQLLVDVFTCASTHGLPISPYLIWNMTPSIKKGDGLVDLSKLDLDKVNVYLRGNSNQANSWSVQIQIEAKDAPYVSKHKKTSNKRLMG